uniref:Uncharacterized protein n=1 Tax=Oryza punctata TaxID=4537 RepID=A0A0E0M4X1_ORYPU
MKQPSHLQVQMRCTYRCSLYYMIHHRMMMFPVDAIYPSLWRSVSMKTICCCTSARRKVER